MIGGSAADHGALVDAVLAWGLAQMRDLPWRRSRDPWEVLVAEVMLQQTQVVRVLPKYAAFLERFPTAASCAAASLGDVLTLWSGLGYPRRARNLHGAAVMVAERFGGRFPSTLAELRELPGVGPYTARAIMVFAFELPVGVVDTNIARTLARLDGARLGPKRVQELSDSLVPVDEPWAWNQILMDLGALRCRPAPDCAACPAAPMCAWHRRGNAPPDPAAGSAGVSVAQAPFAGSDRQARGRLLAALVGAPLRRIDAAAAMGVDDSRATRLVDALLVERLIAEQDGMLGLPGTR